MFPMPCQERVQNNTTYKDIILPKNFVDMTGEQKCGCRYLNHSDSQKRNGVVFLVFHLNTRMQYFASSRVI